MAAAAAHASALGGFGPCNRTCQESCPDGSGPGCQLSFRVACVLGLRARASCAHVDSDATRSFGVLQPPTTAAASQATAVGSACHGLGPGFARDFQFAFSSDPSAAQTTKNAMSAANSPPHAQHICRAVHRTTSCVNHPPAMPWHADMALNRVTHMQQNSCRQSNSSWYRLQTLPLSQPNSMRPSAGPAEGTAQQLYMYIQPISQPSIRKWGFGCPSQMTGHTARGPSKQMIQPGSHAEWRRTPCAVSDSHAATMMTPHPMRSAQRRADRQTSTTSTRIRELRPCR